MRGLARSTWLAAALAIAALAQPGCRCVCGDGEEALARVVRSVPVTEVSLERGAWAAAAQGAELGYGDALRTGEAGRATLEVFGQGTVTIGPGSLVRFGDVPTTAAGGGRELRLTLETGELEVETEYEGAPLLAISGPGGERTVLGQGSRARWSFDEAERLQLDVVAGTARVEAGGETTEVAAGASFVLGEAERVAAADAGPPAPAKAIDAAPEAPDADAGGEAAGALEIRAGGVELEVREPGEGASFRRARGETIALVPGTALRVTGGRRGLELPGPGGAAVLLQPGSSAVFRGVRAGRIDVDLNGGSAEARSSGGGVAGLAVPGGAAETAQLGGAPAFTATVLDGRSTRVAVRSGAASVSSGEQRELVYTGGEVVLGGRQLAVASPAEAPPVFQGSATVYDPQRTGNFTIRFPAIAECPTYAIQVDRGGKRLVEAVTDRPMLAVKNAEYGDYRWRASCVVDGVPRGSEVHEGQVTRRPDSSGHVQLPTKAPVSVLDADGRSYTVTYQNRLPAITLQWTEAPAAPSYTLEVVDDRSGQKIHRSQSARAAHGFKSGALPEGRYVWFFRAEGARRVTSPITTTRVAFDNVSPVVQILEPREGATASGSVRVRGVAVVGSKVEANGVDLALSSDYRFDQHVPVAAGNLLVIRVTAPKRGTGYYVRHLR